MPDSNRGALCVVTVGVLSDRRWGRCSQGHRSQGAWVRRGACQAHGARGWWGGQSARCGAASSGVCWHPLWAGFLPALPLPSLSRRDRSTESLCSRVVSPQRTGGPGRACLFRACGLSPPPPKLPSRASRLLSATSLTAAPPPLVSAPADPALPVGPPRIYRDVYALSKDDSSRGTEVFAPGPAPVCGGAAPCRAALWP